MRLLQYWDEVYSQGREEIHVREGPHQARYHSGPSIEPMGKPYLFVRHLAGFLTEKLAA